MEGQPFFTTVAGLAISLAGFGSVIAWLRDDPTRWDPINLWRVKTIVRHALTIAFLGLSLIPVFTITASERATLRFGSAAIVAFSIYDLWRHRERDPVVWDPPASWQVFMLTTAVFGLLQLLNLWWVSLGVLQVGALVLLTSPAGIFYNFVKEMGRPEGGVGDQTG